MGKLVWSDLGRIMAIVAAMCLVNGGFHSFFFSLPTIPALASPLRFMYRPISLPGFSAFFGGIAVLMMEKPLFEVHRSIKFIFYMLLAVMSFFQFTTVPGATFMLISSLMYFTSLALDESPTEKKDILPVAMKR
ncbi:hypothetical protein BKA69DRAFT_1057558 [Paraphysoderma sedebokerense]|nr:hypothetical protein BKA69DRAFT_1057558 [Paraphysoderma sedebokerense]